MLASSRSFSCSTCEIDLDSSVLQRAHMKSDWHVYNLKRKLALLPPLTSEVYHQSFVDAQNNTASINSTTNSGSSTPGPACEESHRRTEGTKTHLNTLEHLQTLETNSSTSHTSPYLEETTNIPLSATISPFYPSHCLFCTLSSSSLSQSITHMQKSHSFFIPNQEYLIDLETFLQYLHTLIVEFSECLYCGKIKDSAGAVRQHMMSKGHCSLRLDAEEYEGFYDEESEEDKSDTEKRIARKPLVAVDDQLHLPSGRTLGHRSQVRYYRQNKTTLDNGGERKAIEESPDSSRALGIKGKQLTRKENMGMIGVPELKKRALGVLEKKILKRQTRAQNQYQAAVEKGANRQKFFKPDVPGPSNG